MKTSDAGIGLIKQFESFRADPYRDSVGLWTVGYGHKIEPGDAMTTVTEDEALQMLADDLKYSEGIINQHVACPLNQNQFDALASLVFNIGAGKEGVKDGFVTLRSGNESTLLKRLNAGQYEAAAEQFDLWCHADGAEFDGLLARREKEKALFLTPV